ncbi:hypothetical protein DVH24_011167 [Malus domestica]|uniref:Uncharacterized protein n=1 Tax=Malus domestica TaxID=3750 RepID=A0A498JZD6_MALDO|nr:hypothetical protein DVH24_011167 [Malus domestica]
MYRNPTLTIIRVLISYIRVSSTSESISELSPPPTPFLAVDLDKLLLIGLAATVAEVEVDFLQVMSNVGDMVVMGLMDGGGGSHDDDNKS